MHQVVLFTRLYRDARSTKHKIPLAYSYLPVILSVLKFFKRTFWYRPITLIHSNYYTWSVRNEKLRSGAFCTRTILYFSLQELCYIVPGFVIRPECSPVLYVCSDTTKLLPWNSARLNIKGVVA